MPWGRLGAAIGHQTHPLPNRAVDEQLRVRRLARYSLELRVKRFDGLAELASPEREITTEAYERLNMLLDNLPGGSIGIAGPRGSGKTTLIRAFAVPAAA